MAETDFCEMETHRRRLHSQPHRSTARLSASVPVLVGHGGASCHGGGRVYPKRVHVGRFPGACARRVRWSVSKETTNRPRKGKGASCYSRRRSRIGGGSIVLEDGMSAELLRSGDSSRHRIVKLGSPSPMVKEGICSRRWSASQSTRAAWANYVHLRTS